MKLITGRLSKCKSEHNGSWKNRFWCCNGFNGWDFFWPKWLWCKKSYVYVGCKFVSLKTSL